MKKIVLSLVIIMCLALLTVSGISAAETWSDTVSIPPEGTHNITLPFLTKGEELNWNWYTEAGDLHFWIENETGNVEYEVLGDSSDINDTTIPEDGTYELWWENPVPSGSATYDINLTYTVNVINHPPEADASSNKTSGKEPLHVKFTGAGNDVDGYIDEYEWDFGDGSATTNVQNPNHVFSSPGEYTVELTVEDNDGNTDTDTITITVTENPAPTADADADVTSGEPPLEVNFDGSGSSDDPEGFIASYSWNFDDGNTSTEESPTHTFGEEGIYDVVLTVTDNQGKTDTDTVRISVSITNLAPAAAGSADKTTVPQGATVTFTDASTDSDGTIVAWNWDFGDGTTSTDQNPTHVYDEPGTYTVVLVVADDDGASDTLSPAITITVLTDSDGDGYDDANDAFPNDASEWEDTDGDGIGDNADPDDDNDGMSDEWEIIYGLNPKVNDADEDPDEDGYSNLDEFKKGTNPVDVGSRPTESADDGLGASTYIILVVVVILVVILLLFLMKKGAGKTAGAPPEDMGEEAPVEDYGEEPSEEVDEMEVEAEETYEEEPSDDVDETGGEAEEPYEEEPSEEIEEETSEVSPDEELDSLLEDTEEEKPED